MTEERFNELLALILFSIGIFLFISFVTYHPADIPFYATGGSGHYANKAGLIGAYSAFALFFVFGWCAYVIPLIFLFWAVCLFLQRVPEKLLPKIIGFALMQVSLSCLAALFQPVASQVQAGGVLGYVISHIISNYLGFAGTFIYALFFLLVSILLATDFLLYELFSVVGEKFVAVYNSFVRMINLPAKAMTSISQKAEGKRQRATAAKEAKDATRKKRDDEEEKEDPRAALPTGQPKIKKYEDQIKKINKKAPLPDEIELSLEDIDDKLKGVEQVLHEAQELEEEDEELAEEELISEEEDGDAADNEADDEGQDDDETDEDSSDEYRYVAVGAHADEMAGYALPSFDYLKDPVVENTTSDDLHENSERIEKRLADFDIHVKVVEVEQGPVITRYEILPAPGIKLSRIISLQDDIGLTMKTPSVRIAPVAGKSTIGIEVPNSVTNTVYLKELITTGSTKVQKYSLPMFLGKNTSGAPLIADLSDMPHLLIAGTTGSGKTVCVNAIIAGMLYRLDPSQLKFVLIDPKMVELAVYNGIPHLLSPVVTDAKKAASVLNWVVQEMENRYKLLADIGVRNIRAFNSRSRSDREREENIPDRLPYIVVVIDELADLMLTAQDKVETAIARLAQLSRAVGIHLILATQRPSVNVITGVIKANLPARLSFKVASKVDSRTVLDMIGADKLLGKGDMLFLEPGQAKPVRAQSAFISDKEIKDIVHFIKGQKDAEYLDAVQNIVTGNVSQMIAEKDEMYDEAVRVVLETGQASVSVLQRRLRLGYARAARIVDMMEANGVVGSYQGSKPRDILVDRDTYTP